jgi:rhodanese-related sulfurtransferase
MIPTRPRACSGRWNAAWPTAGHPCNACPRDGSLGIRSEVHRRQCADATNIASDRCDAGRRAPVSYSSGCPNPERAQVRPPPRTASQLVTEAKQRIENLTPGQIAAELARGGVLLVDVREAEERVQRGTIPGALHALRGMLEFYADPTDDDHLSEFDPHRRTILYCAGGARSALAVETLRQLGYANVAHLEGGFTAWTTAGCEIAPAPA